MNPRWEFGQETRNDGRPCRDPSVLHDSTFRSWFGTQGGMFCFCAFMKFDSQLNTR